mgnify:CR=1 FL=1
MGIKITQDQLEDVARVSGVMDVDVSDFMNTKLKNKCLQLLPNIKNVESTNAVEAFRFLKHVSRLQ